MCVHTHSVHTHSVHTHTHTAVHTHTVCRHYSVYWHPRVMRLRKTRRRGTEPEEGNGTRGGERNQRRGTEPKAALRRPTWT